MDIDSPVGVGAIGRWLGDLKDGAFESDRVVLRHGALLLETQSLLELLSADFSPGGLSFSRRFGEFTVMLGEVTLQHGLCLLLGLGSRYSQLTDEPVLKGFPQSFDSALGLRGACRG